MPRIPQNLRECAVGMLNAVLTMNAVAMDFGELNNIFQDEFMKFYLNSQRMSDSFNHITESRYFNFKKMKVQNILIWPCFGFLRRMTSWSTYTYSAIYDVMKSYLTRV